jgi:hypothetical protein
MKQDVVAVNVLLSFILSHVECLCYNIYVNQLMPKTKILDLNLED